ncbi:MAG: hypothetical protein H0X30_07655 [Anaerolineae bacterium]|nr:hypothetical protein [Anaerolineae bacterium]
MSAEASAVAAEMTQIRRDVRSMPPPCKTVTRDKFQVLDQLAAVALP